MWRKVSNREADELLQKAITFTGDAKLYGSFMRRAVAEWPISCEQNLLEQSLNKQAWIGHAACCIALNCPEYITRKAWWHLTQEQQDAANLEADAALAGWEREYASRQQQDSEGQLCLKF